MQIFPRLPVISVYNYKKFRKIPKAIIYGQLLTGLDHFWTLNWSYRKMRLCCNPVKPDGDSAAKYDA